MKEQPELGFFKALKRLADPLPMRVLLFLSPALISSNFPDFLPSFHYGIHLMAKGPGFETSSLVSFGLDPRRNGYSRRETDQLIRRIHDDLRASPGMQSSAVAVTQLLTGGTWSNPMTIRRMSDPPLIAMST